MCSVVQQDTGLFVPSVKRFTSLPTFLSQICQAQQRQHHTLRCGECWPAQQGCLTLMKSLLQACNTCSLASTWLQEGIPSERNAESHPCLPMAVLASKILCMQQLVIMSDCSSNGHPCLPMACPHLVSLASRPCLEVIHHPLEQHHAHEHVVVVFRNTLAGAWNLLEEMHKGGCMF